ncbi:MAG TPA: SdrD B-like domain-containing protein [Anaerolineales bacterium]|nr:SdrD B-like domain-containing protein [Anaerolineales bacterium]
MYRVTLLLLTVLIISCTTPPAIQPTAEGTLVPDRMATPTVIVTPSATVTSTRQPRLSPVTYGPEADDFPPDVNPLTGREVLDPSLLKLPAVLVSISNMPVTARPQAGPAFASWVYELYIGEGTTRFLNVFYGDLPRAIPNVTGGCAVREEIAQHGENSIGNRAWLDENENGRQDAWETGIGGVCVRLLDGASRDLIAETTTDSNGYYTLESPSAPVLIQFLKPDTYRFTASDTGDDDRDSDANPNGETIIFQPDSAGTFWDAGLIPTDIPLATPSPVVTGTPQNWFIPSEAYVGPIRSGRLTYNQIGRTFPNSCLVYSGAASDIGEMLDVCEVIPGVERTHPNSSLLTVTRMRELAEASLHPRQPVNYSGNLFSENLPEGGEPASAVHVFYHSYTQSAWRYDPVSHTYLRWTDLADGNGTLIPATDRLTGRQMAFENVIVVFAEHNRFRHNQLEIDFSHGQKHHAYLFRDGQAFKILWSTENREWEKTTGLLRPMHFLDGRGNLIPLRPGRTWIHIITPFSSVANQGKESWLVQFVQPYDPVDTPVP